MVRQNTPILREHQRDAAIRAINEIFEGGHLNASGTGSGKTMTSLAVAKYFADNNPYDYVLILTESRGIIHNAFAKDAELMGIPIYEFGGKPPEEGKQIYVGAYSDVQHGKVRSGEFSTIILDEAHNIRNQLMQRGGKGLPQNVLIESLKHASHVLYATATPMDKPEQVSYRRLLSISPERALLKMGIEVTPKGNLTPVKGMTWDQIEENIDVVWEDVYKDGRALKDEVPLDNTEIFYRRINLSPRDVLKIQRRFEDLRELLLRNKPGAN